MISPLFSQTGNLTITITGIENTKGAIEIGIYDSENTFPAYGKEFIGATETPNMEFVRITFNNIPEGNYAVAVWHDENINQVLDKNFFGAPKENYGFSNNQFGTFGPPNFEVASFKIVDGKSLDLNINLK
jgi:uncharacterized protein (DUF2141 family)